MVLVPHDSVNKLKSLENENHALTSIQTPGDPTSRLDKELTKILNSSKNDAEKWSEYRELFRRFLFFNSDDERPHTKLTYQDINESTQDSSYPVENIINSVPPRYQQKAKAIIDHINTADIDKRFKWDKSGRISINNNKIPNTNIVDLLNDALRYRKSHNAVGQKEFAKFLRGINTPRNFVGNDNFWESPNISEDDDDDDEETLLFSTPLAGRSQERISKRLGTQFPDGEKPTTSVEAWQRLSPEKKKSKKTS